MEQQSNAVSRRGIIVGLGASVAVAAAAGSAKAMPFNAAGTGSRSLSLGGSTMADWTAMIGSKFTLATESGLQGYTLVAVEPLSVSRAPVRGVRRQAFTAIFSPGRARLAAGNKVYAVAHADFGRTGIYFSPTAGSSTGRIEAIFA
jgi:hypothetical protein